MGKAEETQDLEVNQHKESLRTVEKQYEKLTADIEAFLKTLKGNVFCIHKKEIITNTLLQYSLLLLLLTMQGK